MELLLCHQLQPAALHAGHHISLLECVGLFWRIWYYHNTHALRLEQ